MALAAVEQEGTGTETGPKASYVPKRTLEQFVLPREENIQVQATMMGDCVLKLCLSSEELYRELCCDSSAVRQGCTGPSATAQPSRAAQDRLPEQDR